MVQQPRYNPRRINKKVIVIGSGIGGLSSALRLQQLGFDVEIIEKNPTVGGKTNAIYHNGFTFDLSATILMLPEPYIELFEFIEEDYSKYFTIKPLDINYKLFCSSGECYDFSPYLPKLISTISELSNDDCSNFLKLLGEINYKYNLVNKSFLCSPLVSSKDIFNGKKLLNLMKTTPFKTCYEYLNKRISNENFLNFLLFQCMYVGTSPFEASNIYSLIPAMSFLQGLWHIEGGIYSYIKSLEKIFLSRGGQISLNTEVENILFNHNTAIGVKLKNKETNLSDLVVCNADYSYSLLNLLPKQEVHSKMVLDNKPLYSPSTFIIYLGTNKKYDNLNIHNILIGEDFNGNLHAPFENKLSLNPPLYIYCPSRIDSTLTPTLYNECLNIIVRVPNLLDNTIDWSDPNFIKEYRDIILSNLKKYKGFEDIESHIEYESYLTPLTYENTFNTYGGSSFGLSHITSQSLFFRPQCKLSPYKNLYFVGASIHPGNGVSMVLNSSKILVDEILKDLGN